jgi:hypothetical protein
VDAFNMAFYAMVCGGLAGVSARVGRWPARVILGMIVGLAAAAALPALRAALGVGG